MRRAKTLAFHAATLLSLIFLAVLSLGYVGSFGVWLSHRPTAGDFRKVSVDLDRGRVALWWHRETPPFRPPGLAATIPPGLHHQVGVNATVRWPPEWRRAIWEFDAHVVNSTPSAGLSTFLLACPIWCVAVVCMILPAIWWRRHRAATSRHVEGFAVLDAPVTAATTTTPPG